MRKALLFFILSVMLSGVALAQHDIGYLAFFTDDTRTTNCVATESIPDPPANVVNAYIYCLPGPLGQRCAEFQVNFPENTQLLTTINGPNVSLPLGDLQTGIAIAVDGCLTDWFWLMQVVFYVNDTNPSALAFAASSVSFKLVFCSCETGYPEEDIRVLNELLLNVDPTSPGCVYATKETSWGAIKNLYK